MTRAALGAVGLTAIVVGAGDVFIGGALVATHGFGASIAACGVAFAALGMVALHHALWKKS